MACNATRKSRQRRYVQSVVLIAAIRSNLSRCMAMDNVAFVEETSSRVVMARFALLPNPTDFSEEKTPSIEIKGVGDSKIEVVACSAKAWWPWRIYWRSAWVTTWSITKAWCRWWSNWRSAWVTTWATSETWCRWWSNWRSTWVTTWATSEAWC